MWAEGKSTCETSPKGSATGKSYEAAFYRASQSRSKVLCPSSRKKRKESNKQTSRRLQMSNEPLMRNHSCLNWTNIPGIQSHCISQEKIPVQVLGTGFFFFSTSGSTHRNDHLYTHYSPDTSSLIKEVISLLVP